MVEVLMVVLSVPAGLAGWGLGVLLRRQREVGAHECGESVESVCERVSGPRLVPTHPVRYTEGTARG